MKHAEDSNKHIIEEIVRQVGYLPEIYEDARSEKYKIRSYESFRSVYLVSRMRNEFEIP
jgi:hypothetical protein